MHEFYSPHLHHSISTHIPSSTSPPLSSHLHHPIHNPTPSYPHHSTNLDNISPPNGASSMVYASSQNLMQDGTAQPEPTQQDNNSLQNDINVNTESSVSNTGLQYSSSSQLPPTPNSLVTMMGPNSGKTLF